MKKMMLKRFMKSKDVKNLKPQNAQWSVCHYLSAVMERAKRKLHDEREISSCTNRNTTTAPVPTNGATDIITPVNNDDQPSTTPSRLTLRLKLNIEASIGITGSSNAKIPDKRTSKKRKIEDSIYIPESSKAPNNTKKKLCERSINIKCKKAVNVVSYGPFPPPPLPEAYKNAIRNFLQGRSLSGEIKLVIQKGLFSSDLNPGQNRLLIPANKVITADFLNEEEKRSIGSHDEKNNNKLRYMEVKVIDPDLELRTLNLNRWEMRTSFNYVLNGKWMEIVRRCKLEPEMVLQVWSFRVDGVLGFALVRLPLEDN